MPKLAKNAPKKAKKQRVHDDKQGRQQFMMLVYSMLTQNPIVAQNPMHLYSVTRMVLEAIGVPDIQSLIGTPEELQQQMHKFKHGTLHSGSKTGPKVKNRDQAIAIALSEAGEGKKDKKSRKRRGKMKK